MSARVHLHTGNHEIKFNWILNFHVISIHILFELTMCTLHATPRRITLLCIHFYWSIASTMRMDMTHMLFSIHFKIGITVYINGWPEKNISNPSISPKCCVFPWNATLDLTKEKKDINRDKNEKPNQNQTPSDQTPIKSVKLSSILV